MFDESLFQSEGRGGLVAEHGTERHGEAHDTQDAEEPHDGEATNVTLQYDFSVDYSHGSSMLSESRSAVQDSSRE
jgi:hypothetical protein